MIKVIRLLIAIMAVDTRARRQGWGHVAAPVAQLAWAIVMCDLNLTQILISNLAHTLI